MVKKSNGRGKWVKTLLNERVNKIVGAITIIMGVFLLSLIPYAFSTDPPFLRGAVFAIFGIFSLSLGFTIFYQKGK